MGYQSEAELENQLIKQLAAWEELKKVCCSRCLYDVHVIATEILCIVFFQKYSII